MRIFGHDEDDENTKEELDAFLKLSRISRRKLLARGDPSKDIEDPFESISARVLFAMAEDQEHAESHFGKNFLVEHTFTKGAFRWLTEPGDRDRTMILFGVMMSIQNAQTMIDIINDLGLNDKAFMEMAAQQIEHLHEHQQECAEALKRAAKDLDPDEILSEVEDMLGDQEVDADKE